MLGFRQDLTRELSGLTLSFQSSGEHDGRANVDGLGEQLLQWRKTGSHNGMLRAVYLVEEVSGEQPVLSRLNTTTRRFESTAWPQYLTSVQDALPHSFMHGAPPPGMERNPHALWRQKPMFRGGLGDRPDHHGPPWFIEASIPVLIHPLDAGAPEHGQSMSPARWMILELDRTFFEKHLFPELAARYFPDTDDLGYDVAVVTGSDEEQSIYSSNPQISEREADATLDLFGPSGPPHSVDSVIPHFRGGPQPAATLGHAADFPRAAPMALPRRQISEEGNWRLVVKNRQGSLETAVSRLRRRNLAVSFGILLVLATTMAMVIIASQRARRLGQLQIDFVTGVSHELRTPITVISSAAENIADGLVSDREQITQYGRAIRSQAAQLKQLVEQILLFAATRRGAQHYALRRVDIAAVIDMALGSTSEVIDAAGFIVERSVPSNLPPVMVDTQALSQCLQNLITNAVKYSDGERWLGVRAATREIAAGTEALITVSDRGIGIESHELKHIFEPFYRSSRVRDEQIHGSGLGLPLAMSMVKAMGGYISVESSPGNGSAFTVHLAVAESTVPQTNSAVPVPAASNAPLAQS